MNQLQAFEWGYLIATERVLSAKRVMSVTGQGKTSFRRGIDRCMSVYGMQLHAEQILTGEKGRPSMRYRIDDFGFIGCADCHKAGPRGELAAMRMGFLIASSQSAKMLDLIKFSNANQSSVYRALGLFAKKYPTGLLKIRIRDSAGALIVRWEKAVQRLPATDIIHAASSA